MGQHDAAADRPENRASQREPRAAPPRARTGRPVALPTGPPGLSTWNGADTGSRVRVMLALQQSAGMGPAVSLLPSVQRDPPTPTAAPATAAPPTAAPGAAAPDATAIAEPVRTLDYQGQHYVIKQSEWPSFVAGLKRAFQTQVVRPLDQKMSMAAGKYQLTKKLNEDQWAVAWVLEATRTGINLDEVAEPIRLGQEALTQLQTLAAGDDLLATQTAARAAELAVNRASAAINEYVELQIGSGDRAVIALEVTSTVCFTIFALAGGAVLAAPVAAGGLGLGVVSSGAIMGGATGLLSSASAVGGKAVVGDEVGWEDLKNVAIDTAAGAAGGAIGAGVAARLGPYLAPALARSLQAQGLFAGVAEAALVAEVRHVVSGAGAGMVQGAIADGIRVLQGRATFDQLLRNVVTNLVVGGLVGLVAARLPVTRTPPGGTGGDPAPASTEPSSAGTTTAEPSASGNPSTTAKPSPAPGETVTEVDGPPTVRPPPPGPVAADQTTPVPAPGVGAPEPTLVNSSNGQRYAVSDSSNPRLQAMGTLEGEGELSLTIRAVLEDGTRSKVIEGSTQFQRILQYFGSRVQSIRGSWSYGSNLGTVNELTARGMPLEQAAQQTWTGGQATSAGYTNVRVVSSEGSPGSYTKVKVLFTK